MIKNIIQFTDINLIENIPFTTWTDFMIRAQTTRYINKVIALQML